ncbi:hypothetical protein SKAU_G00119690 [Synaphobranchus kaupii]|uniref:Uncharacterized protein n=1 Tax=Synaphobranchus kaupii TaxID=118154 RepID=A0A9Q1J298_SYNKA|nr:hypothetical protein SKAU_G00119690 [Synaphobranchus kaupii]
MAVLSRSFPCRSTDCGPRCHGLAVYFNRQVFRTVPYFAALIHLGVPSGNLMSERFACGLTKLGLELSVRCLKASSSRPGTAKRRRLRSTSSRRAGFERPSLGLRMWPRILGLWQDTPPFAHFLGPAWLREDFLAAVCRGGPTVSRYSGAPVPPWLMGTVMGIVERRSVSFSREGQTVTCDERTLSCAAADSAALDASR